MQIIEYRNSNSLTAFPFDQTSTMTGLIEGTSVLVPNDFVIDANITTDQENLFVSNIQSTATSIILTISFRAQDLSLNTVGLVSVSKLDTGDIERPIDGLMGSVTFRNISFLNNILGDISFADDGLVFLPRVLRQDTFGGVVSFRDIVTGEEASGTVTFGPGFNIDISVDDANNTIIFSARRGAGLGVFCGEECPEPEECPTCVKTINGIPPTRNGDFAIISANNASVENVPDENKIILGTNVPDGRIDCTRTGVQAPQGPQGPIGPRGRTGAAAGPLGGIPFPEEE